MPPRLPRVVLFTVFSLTLLLSACNTAATEPPPPPTATEAASDGTQLSAKRTETELNVLEACDITAQSAAMKPETTPDWDALNPAACYDLTLDLDPDGSDYTGTAVITLNNQTGESLPDVVFRIYPNSDEIYGGSLIVEETAINGKSIEGQVFQEDETAYRITLEEPLPPRESIVVEMSFRGEIPEDFADLSTVYGVFNQDTSEQFISMANWYPILAQWEAGEWLFEEVIGNGDAVVSETALYKVQVSAPQDWEIITTGSEIDGPDGSDLFVSGPVRDFIVLASPNFTQLMTEVDGTTIRHWGLPGGEARWEEALQATSDSIDIFNERFGDYPYSELDVIAAPLKNALGVEYPGVFLIGDSLYEPNQPREFLLGLVVAHEAAHQWWYGVVGNDVLLDPWQDEALTTFSSTLYQEIYQPRYYQGTLDAYQGTVDQVEEQYSSENLAIAQPVESFQGRGALYSPVVYQKGGLFFHTLREELGEKVFFDALQTYYDQNRYLRVPSETLLDAFEASCQCDLDDIYREWGVDTN